VELTVDSRQRALRLARAHPWVAVIVAAIIFALIGLPLFFAVPVIGVALAAGAPPDYVANAKTVHSRPRTIIAVAPLAADAQPGYLSRSTSAIARCEA
jgi:hypothetical protein